MSNYQRYHEMQEAFKGLTVTRKTTPGYAHADYTIIVTPLPDNPRQYTAHDGAVFADYGNLCFGGRDFAVQVRGDDLIFTGTVHTD
jgi:hypothetical protein